MKVFISGIAGFIGSHLADAWLAKGAEVSGCDNLLGGYEDNVPEGVTFSAIDCNDWERLRTAMKGAELVVHSAATAHEGLSVFSPHFITKHIVGATSAMVSAAVACDVKRFVYLSSASRYGNNPVPCTEDMTPAPVDPYGIGKVAGEHLLVNIAETHGMEWVIAVPHNVIGPRQKYDDPYRNVASIFINLALQGRSPIIYGDGSHVRCFSFVDDVVQPLVRLGEDSACTGQVFNVGPDEGEVTILELARTVARIVGTDVEPIFMSDRPREVPRTGCSADKARRLLGYEPKTSLEDGLRSMVDAIRVRGARPFDYYMPLEIVNDQTPKSWVRRLF
jgi:UDP-glucose 4-epimerase